MIEEFNGIFYLLFFLIHFLIYAVYAIRAVVKTKGFIDQYGMDDSSAGMVRFFGAPFIASFLMALYLLFIREEGIEGTWGFFVLIFAQNLFYFIIGFYTYYIDKLGHNDKTTNEGVIASGVLTILSAILCYGLADKIYI